MPDSQKASHNVAPAERRLDYRVRHRAAVFVEVASSQPGSGDMPSLVLCQVLDLSANGVRVRIDRQLEHGSLLNLMVKFPGGQRPLHLVGEVRWSEQHERSWHVGFSLFESIQTDIADWKEWIAEVVL